MVLLTMLIPHRSLKKRAGDFIGGTLKDLIPIIVDDSSDLTQHVSFTHVCRELREQVTRDKVCYILQNNSLMDCCRLYIQKQENGNLMVKNQEIETFATQTKVLCCLDQLMLVKEHNEQNLCVINQLTKSKVILPKPDARWKPNDREGFNILYDGGRHMYVFLHVWQLPEDHLGLKKSKVGCEVIGFRNGGVVSSSWKTIFVENVYKGWEHYLSDMVTIKARQVFWDIRCHDYMVRFDVGTEKLKKVMRPINNVSAKQDSSMLRTLFEGDGRLVLSYASPARVIFYFLNKNTKWQYIKTMQHSEQDLKKIPNKKPLTGKPFPTCSILFRRYLLFNKTVYGGSSIQYFDLRNEVVTPLAGFGGYYPGNNRWVRQISTMTADW